MTGKVRASRAGPPCPGISSQVTPLYQVLSFVGLGGQGLAYVGDVTAELLGAGDRRKSW